MCILNDNQNVVWLHSLYERLCKKAPVINNAVEGYVTLEDLERMTSTAFSGIRYRTIIVPILGKVTLPVYNSYLFKDQFKQQILFWKKKYRVDMKARIRLERLTHDDNSFLYDLVIVNFGHRTEHGVRYDLYSYIGLR